MNVQLGGIAAAYIYATPDKPLYHKGNSNLLYINIAIVVLFVPTRVYYVQKNKSKKAQVKVTSYLFPCHPLSQIPSTNILQWNALTPQEKLYYQTHTKLDFQFAY
jgi:hypothetical protein